MKRNSRYSLHGLHIVLCSTEVWPGQKFHIFQSSITTPNFRTLQKMALVSLPC